MCSTAVHSLNLCKKKKKEKKKRGITAIKLIGSKMLNKAEKKKSEEREERRAWE